MNITLNTATRLYQKVGLQLIDRITSGELKVGDRLPPERQIAAQMQVSRAVIRESLIMLELKGLVEIRKGSGVYVINIQNEITNDTSDNSNINNDDVGPFELLQARQLLESHVAEFAATQVTKNDISRLRLALDVERKNLEDDCSDYDGDKMFHMAIVESTQNSVLIDMVNDLWKRREDSSMWHQLHSRIENQNYRHGWIKDHEKILTALQKKDPAGARESMWLHLENVKEKLFELSDIDDPQFDGFLFESYTAVKI